MEQRDKLKRHFFLIVIFITFLFYFAGQLLYGLVMAVCPIWIKDAGTIFLLMYASFIAMWIVTILYCRFAEKEICNSFKSARRGGRKGNTFKNLAIGLFIGFALNGLSALAAFLNGDLEFSFSTFDILYLVIGLLAVFIQSGAEEITTRGYMYSAIESRYGVVIAFIVNSLFFAAMHGSNDGITLMAILHLIVTSVLLSLCVWRYDSLWMAMGIHTTWNYTQSLLLGLPNSGIVSEKALLHLDAASDSIFYSTSFGLEGGILAVILQLAIVVFIFIEVRRKKQQTSNNDQ